jgi:hypothetical protein
MFMVNYIKESKIWKKINFSDEVEQWLHDQGILTIGLDTWKQ